MKKSLGADSELIASHGGVFEITLGDELIFSKRSLNRFPEDGEVVDLIRSRSS